MDIHKKDLILHANHSKGTRPEEGVTHFITCGVVLEVMTILPGENKGQSLHDIGQENVS